MAHTSSRLWDSRLFITITMTADTDLTRCPTDPAQWPVTRPLACRPTHPPCSPRQCVLAQSLGPSPVVLPTCRAHPACVCWPPVTRPLACRPTHLPCSPRVRVLAPRHSAPRLSSYPPAVLTPRACVVCTACGSPMCSQFSCSTCCA